MDQYHNKHMHKILNVEYLNTDKKKILEAIQTNKQTVGDCA